MKQTKNRRLAFEVKVHRRSTHFVSVQLHSSRKTMRSVLRRLGHDPSHTDAACWQPNRFAKDNCVAEIHLAHDLLTYERIAHEAAHAAFHRAVLIGIPFSDGSFQEYLAEDTGVISDGIIRFCRQRKIRILLGRKLSQNNLLTVSLR